MAANKPVWGIDLGQSALKAICLRLAGEKVEVVDHVYIEHARILSHPDADRPALIAETVEKFLDKHDLSNQEIVVGVPGQHTLARFSKLPPVDARKIPEIVKYEAQQQIPFDMDEVIWDYQIFENPQAMETEVGIFAMRRDLLREHLHWLSSRNLEPAAVQSCPLALCNALKFDGICDAGSLCILDIGAQNTDLIVVDGESLWTRNIPIGGNNFTEVLLETFKLSFNKAERLKRDAQKHKYARQIFQAMRPVFADLVAEIQRSIGFFTSSRRGVKLGKIIAMGNAFQLPGMMKFLQQNLGMQVVRPSTFNRVATSNAPNAPQLMDRLLSYAVAYGLALQGLGAARITSSLLPPEIAKQVIWRKKTPWFYGVAASLAVSAAIVWGRNVVDAGVVADAEATGPTLVLPQQYDPNDTEKRNPKAAPEAYRIVQSGLTASTAVGKAKEVLAVGDHLKTILSDVNSINDDAIKRAKEVQKLQADKRVWPAIIEMIHSTLPAPDPDLAKALAAGPEAYKALIEKDPKKYARAKRKEIFITSLTPTYWQDVMAAYQTMMPSESAAPAPGARGGMEATAKASHPQPGFLIEMTLRSPNEGGFLFVNDAFLSKLSQAVVEDVARCVQARVRETRHGSDKTRVRSSGDDDQPVTTERVIDPVTEELMNEDWEFDAVAVVILERQSENRAVAGDVGGSDLDENY